jgi:PP-loop superfamily ATP-utilizing enzyme
LEDDLFARVAEQLKQIGYAHVTLDLAGYRRGSLNEQIVLRPSSIVNPV